jgi:hypothetical protein
MRKTDLKELRKLLVKNSVPISGIKYLEDLIEIYTQPSSKLPEEYRLPGYMERIVGPIGRTHTLHLYGHPTSGKTAIISDIINKLPKDMVSLWIDTTFTFSPNLIKDKEQLFIFPTAHIKPTLDVVNRYAVVVLDDFAGVQDPQNVSMLISKCKQAGTLLVILNQIRQFGKVPAAMRSKVMILCDITINSQRAENRTNSAFYQLVCERHRTDGHMKGQYTMLEITKQGAVHEKQQGTGGRLGGTDMQHPE